jgi:hypothetical protein
VVKRGMGVRPAPRRASARTSATSASTSTRSTWRCRAFGRLLTDSTIADIRRRRVENYRRLAERLDPDVIKVFSGRPPKARARCSSRLWCRTSTGRPKRCAPAASTRSSSGTTASSLAATRWVPTPRFLRRHVLELPIHQDLTARHIDHVARQVSNLHLGMAA